MTATGPREGSKRLAQVRASNVANPGDGPPGSTQGKSTRVVKIGVKGLFGRFNHEIRLDSKERVTIIHGPNGYGKTTLLKMIAALARGRVGLFEHTPFSEFRVTFDDGSAWVVGRTIDREKPGVSSTAPALRFAMVDAEGRTSQVPHRRPAWPKGLLDRMDQHVPGPFVRQGDGWDDGEGQHYTPDQIVERFPILERHIPPKFRHWSLHEFPETLQVFFVETNRLSAQASREDETAFSEEPHYYRSIAGPMLSRFAGEGSGLRVQQYSADVVSRISALLARYARHSQERDRTFPERLVDFARKRSKRLPARKILEQLDELEVKRQRLIVLGILDRESGLRGLSETDVTRSRDALTIYVRDIESKLKVFDDLADRMGRLIDTINGRFKYKRLTIDRERGFRVITDSGQTIALEDLSSGEQHQLVVLYELLFCAPRGCLLLIDEPEISLHVAWQCSFLSDLISVLDVIGGYAIVATHSPTIIGERWDLTKELTGPGPAGKKRANA